MLTDAQITGTRTWDTAVESTQATLAVLLGAIALLGPPALVLAGLWLLFVRIRRRWFPVTPLV